MTGDVTVYISSTVIGIGGDALLNGRLLMEMMGRERMQDLEADSAPRRLVRLASGPSTASAQVTLRYAGSDDRSRLRHLAALGRLPAPDGCTLVAEVDGQLRAALPLRGGAALVDPRHPAAELVELLQLRAIQLDFAC